MSEQTQPETALQSLAEKLRTDAIAIFGDGLADRDIIEWFYGALLAAAPAHPAERQDKKPLDERMRAAGMMTVADRLAGAPLDAFIKHAGVNDLSSLLQWAEMRRADWLKMQARYDLGERDKSDELYEWTIAHCAVFTELHVNIRAALAGEKERQEQEDLHVWRATTRFGETCHFGEASTARAWAGENGTVERVELTPVPELRLVERQEQEEVQRLREMLERATKLLSAAAGYATKMEPMPAKLLNAIDTALAACPGQEVGK